MHTRHCSTLRSASRHCLIFSLLIVVSIASPIAEHADQDNLSPEDLEAELKKVQEEVDFSN